MRRQRFTGQRIARESGDSPATVSHIRRRAGLRRIKDLEPPEPVVRYEREHPGELIHIDIKKLGRIEGVGRRESGGAARFWTDGRQVEGTATRLENCKRKAN